MRKKEKNPCTRKQTKINHVKKFTINITNTIKNICCVKKVYGQNLFSKNKFDGKIENL